MEASGERMLNMIHRDDVIGCVLAALERGKPGEVYNAVDDEPTSQLEFFGWLARTLGRQLPPSMPEDSNARTRGTTNKRVSNQKLQAELGYRFRYPNFRSGYAAEIQRLRQAGELRLESD